MTDLGGRKMLVIGITTRLPKYVNSIIQAAYNKYCSHLFDSSFSINRKRFWSLIKALQKDYRL